MASNHSAHHLQQLAILPAHRVRGRLRSVSLALQVSLPPPENARPPVPQTPFPLRAPASRVIPTAQHVPAVLSPNARLAPPLALF